MVYLDKLIIFLFALSLTTPLYASFLGTLNLNILVTLIYAVGLLSYILFNINRLKYHFLDFLIIFFCLFFICSISYTLNNNYLTNFLLFFVLPLYYFSGKITKEKVSSNYLFLLLILFTLIIDIYVLIKLIDNNFIYHTYYHYSNSMLKLDYLTMSQYSFISFILLLFNKNSSFISNKIVILFLLVFFILMILISGSRFTISFLFIFLLIYMFTKLNRKNLIKLVMSLFISLFFIFNYININTLFQYTINRFDSATKEDNSINERKIFIEKALTKINESPLIGYGINSTENILNVKYVHNMFLETFLETGIFNFFILSFIILYILFICIKNRDYSIITLYIYLVLSYSKSFTVSEAKFLFFIIGFIMMTNSIKNLNNAN